MMNLALQNGLADGGVAWLLIPVALGITLFGLVVAVARRYKRCPSNRILVIYGRGRKGESSRTQHGGGKFVWPLIEDYEYLSLDPMQIEIPLEGALSIENIRVSVPSVFTVAIGTDADTMNNAAIRLLGLTTTDIIKQAEDIIFGQLRQVIASMRIEEINRDRDVFLGNVQSSLEPELKKIGLVLINVNIKDITDESGYIEAIGRKAAAEGDQPGRGRRGRAGASRVPSVWPRPRSDRRPIQVANAEKVRADRDQGGRAGARASASAELERETRRSARRTPTFEQEVAVSSDAGA